MAFLSDAASKGELLSDAVSLIRKFSDEVVVIKYDGSSLSDPEKVQIFAQDLVLLKSCGINVILVHGAGLSLGQTLKKLGVKLKTVAGVPIASKENLDLFEMVLSGHINRQIVLEICKAGGVAIGFSGKDASMITAKKMVKTHRDKDTNIETILDFGYTGIPDKISTDIFEIIGESEVIPVISPVGFDENYNTFIMNADDVASIIAASLGANRLILMTEEGGILDENSILINSITLREAEQLRRSKLFTGISHQKLDVCLKALKAGVSAIHLINVQDDHSVLLELLTKERTGTLIQNTDPAIEIEIDFEDQE